MVRPGPGGPTYNQEMVHDPYGVFRIRDYRCLLSAGVLGSIGMEVQAVAVGWDLYVRTSSAAMLGYAGLAQFLPVLLFSLPAGHLADRYSRKRLYQIAQAAVAACSLGLAGLTLGEGPVLVVLVLLFLTGMARALSVPSRASLVPQVVPLELLASAITWNSSGWQIANVVGPAVGGAVIALAGTAEAFHVAAACSLASVALAAPIRVTPGNRAHTSPSLESLLAGVRFVYQTRLLLAAITLDLFAVLLGGATALLPIFARDILEVGPTGLGWLRAAPAVGAFGMAMLLAHRPPLSRTGIALLLAVAGFGAATIVFGLSQDPLLSFIMLALTGAFDNISVVVRHTLVQVLTPDAMRGRVSAVNLVFISSSNELGAFESGVTAEWFGPVLSVVGGGVGTILVVLAAMAWWPELLRLGPLHRLRSPREDEVKAGPDMAQS
ncbi:MAG: MFS transporter [Planctomycetes bacterium]|nr:MFS transporter [Planctomycetota bacterium]